MRSIRAKARKKSDRKKLKSCKAPGINGGICGNKFEPRTTTQSACSMECAIRIANKKRADAERSAAKEERASIAKQKRELKMSSTRMLMPDVERAFNQYIRERDRAQPCISCGNFTTGQYHAGHYRPKSTSPSLRFNELNVHKQCAHCNLHKHGNLTLYRINLIKKIGLEMVEWLEGPHEPRRYRAADLIEILEAYKTKKRELVSSRPILLQDELYGDASKSMKDDSRNSRKNS